MKLFCKSKENIVLSEKTEHILTSCGAYDEIRERIFPQYESILKNSKLRCSLHDFQENNEKLCQFLLDPTSLNLKWRIPTDDPSLDDIFKLSRDLCYVVSSRVSR